MKQQAQARARKQADDASFFLLFSIDGESYAYPLERINEAFDAVRERKVVKALVRLKAGE